MNYTPIKFFLEKTPETVNKTEGSEIVALFSSKFYTSKITFACWKDFQR